MVMSFKVNFLLAMHKECVVRKKKIWETQEKWRVFMDFLTLAIIAMQFTPFGDLIFSLVGLYKAAHASGMIG